jgi:DNA-binding response OmpR family regulator
MSTIEKRKSRAGPPGFALVMESDPELRAVLRAALLLDGHLVECVSNCAGVLARRKSVGALPDELVLALGAGELDADWKTLQVALDEDAVLTRVAVIVLLTIRNGLTFPARARILQKPFAIEELLALVASDVAAAQRLPV